MDALAVGFGLGFLVALQLGPMSLLLIRCTLRSGARVGVAIGGGIALVDALYAAAGAAGASAFVRIDVVRIALGLAGAAVLVYLGVRGLLAAVHVRAGLDVPSLVARPVPAFLTSLGATASNPLTIVSWAAVFGSVAVVAELPAPLLVVGVGLGSLTSVTSLALGVAFARRVVTPRVLRVADGCASGGLIGFGGYLAYDATRTSG